MLSYARNQRSNVYQMVKGYFTFVYNVAKRCIDVLHFMGLCVSYKTIRVALKDNAKEVELKIQDMVWHNRFFISFDNMNFYEHTRDQRLHNKGHQLNYTAGYICLMDTGIDTQRIDGDAESLDGGAEAVSSNWKHRYLDSNQVDLSAVLRLEQEDFELADIEFRHRTDSSKHIISLILGRYFAKELKAQKVWRNGKP